MTFVCAYIPYIGAFFAGAFAVVIALGSEGTTTALIMLVVVILANGALQQIVQPIAYGATLGSTRWSSLSSPSAPEVSSG